jgi:hypothetical protein
MTRLHQTVWSGPLHTVCTRAFTATLRVNCRSKVRRERAQVTGDAGQPASPSPQADRRRPEDSDEDTASRFGQLRARRRRWVRNARLMSPGLRQARKISSGHATPRGSSIAGYCSGNGPDRKRVAFPKMPDQSLVGIDLHRISCMKVRAQVHVRSETRLRNVMGGRAGTDPGDDRGKWCRPRWWTIRSNRDDRPANGWSGLWLAGGIDQKCGTGDLSRRHGDVMLCRRRQSVNSYVALPHRSAHFRRAPQVLLESQRRQRAHGPESSTPSFLSGHGSRTTLRSRFGLSAAPVLSRRRTVLPKL